MWDCHHGEPPTELMQTTGATTGRSMWRCTCPLSTRQAVCKHVLKRTVTICTVTLFTRFACPVGPSECSCFSSIHACWTAAQNYLAIFGLDHTGQPLYFRCGTKQLMSSEAEGAPKPRLMNPITRSNGSIDKAYYPLSPWCSALDSDRNGSISCHPSIDNGRYGFPAACATLSGHSGLPYVACK